MVMWIRDLVYVLIKYVETFKRPPNLLSPSTFNEKVQHRKLFNRSEQIAMACNKLAVKEHVAGVLGDEYVPETLGIYKSGHEFQASDINEDCVLKSSVGWNDIVFLRQDDISESDVAVKIDQVLNAPLPGWNRGEWGYRASEPVAFLEEDLSTDGHPPPDYKFYCFHGRVAMCHIHVGRFAERRRLIVDRHKEVMDFSYARHTVHSGVDVSNRYDQMVEAAELVSQSWDFIRVDMYDVQGRILVGELTPYPTSGLARFDPPEYDKYFGSLW